MEEHEISSSNFDISNTTSANIPKERSIKVKYIIFFLVVVAIAMVVYFLRGLVFAATVNGTPISRFSVLLESEKQAGKGVLDYLIVKKLIQAEARAKQITVSSDDVKNEIQKLETSLSSQGQTLAAFLQAQSISEQELTDQVTLQKQVTELVPAPSVTDADVEAYIKENSISFPPEADQNAEKQKVKDFLMGQKQNEAIQAYIAALREKASIQYFVTY